MSKIKRNLLFTTFLTVMLALTVLSQAGEASIVGEEMAAEAKTLVGTRYKYGGTTPSQGFDSSGLIYYLHQKQGISIPRTVAGQYQGGRPVSPSNLKPGDVLIFRDSQGKPSISALYIGQQQAVASLPSSQGVQLHSVDTKWAKDHFLAAKRYSSGSSAGTQPVSSPPSSAERQTTLGDQIIKTGEKYLGAPYKYGAKAGSGYFDCSLFTQTVFAEHGIKLPRSSRQQAQVGTYVKWGEWQKGDLLFFWTRATGKGNVGHVAIYAGDGKILHTWGSPGVTYNKITDRAWRETYMGARRVIQ